MVYFNFKRLIEKYSSDFTLDYTTEGGYNSLGEWEDGTTVRKTLRGAILSNRETKIFRSEGKITSKDEALYMLEPLENALHGARVIYADKVYSIGDLLENSKFTGVWAYTLKYVSAFKEERPEYDITEELDDLEDRLNGVLTSDEATTDTELSGDELAEMLEKRLDGGEGNG